jgi:hypothetical protein
MRLLLIIMAVVAFQLSCSQRQDKKTNFLVFISLGRDKTISYKLTSSDTLFREIKTRRIVDCTYRVLTKAERKDLLDLISRLQTTMKSDSSFEIGTHENLLIISNKNGKAYYTQGNRTQYVEFDKVTDRFKRYDSQDDFKNVDRKSTFWDIEGIMEPPPPPNPIDTVNS